MHSRTAILLTSLLLTLHLAMPGTAQAASPADAPQEFRIASYDEALQTVTLTWLPPGPGDWTYTLYADGEPVLRLEDQTTITLPTPESPQSLFATARGPTGTESAPSPPVLFGQYGELPINFSICTYFWTIGITTSTLHIWFSLLPQCIPQVGGDPFDIHCAATSPWFFDPAFPFITNDIPADCRPHASDNPEIFE